MPIASQTSTSTRRVAALALERPLGAFYRVNTTRLDDMQSAITELFGIVASAVDPRRLVRARGRDPDASGRRSHDDAHHHADRTSRRRSAATRSASSGTTTSASSCRTPGARQWGDKGFATLPYDDWLESGYDAWVARPGRPLGRVSRGSAASCWATPAARGFVEAPGPDLQRAVEARGEPRQQRPAVAERAGSPARKTQIDSIFAEMAATHAAWASEPRRIVLYAHGGLNSEQTGLDIAQRQLDWWLSNQVYPDHLRLADRRHRDPARTSCPTSSDERTRPAVTFNLFEQVDRMIEKTAKRTLRWMWDEMKENAGRRLRAATSELARPARRRAPWCLRRSSPGLLSYLDGHAGCRHRDPSRRTQRGGHLPDRHHRAARGGRASRSRR